MLEIRYIKGTGILTGWWGDRHGNEAVKLKNRSNEAMTILDIPVPGKSPDAWLFDEQTQSLVVNPSYVEPAPPRNLQTEIDELQAKLDRAGII